MSWSRSYSGTPEEVLKAADADRPAIEKDLPEFERAQVGHVTGAAGHALQSVPEDAKVSVNLSGHGYQNTAPAPGDTAQSGGLGVSISYSVVAPQP